MNKKEQQLIISEQSVKTGDNTMIGSYAIIMLLAVGAYTATKR